MALLPCWALLTAHSAFYRQLLCAEARHRWLCGDMESCLGVLRTTAACQSMPAAQVPEQLRLLVTHTSFFYMLRACFGEMILGACHYDIACASSAVKSRWLGKPFGIRWLESQQWCRRLLFRLPLTRLRTLCYSQTSKQKSSCTSSPWCIS